jgi:hypothetical protein
LSDPDAAVRLRYRILELLNVAMVVALFGAGIWAVTRAGLNT